MFLKNLIQRALEGACDFSSRRIEVFGAQYRAFAIFSIINYPVAFLFLYFLGGLEQENLAIRLIAVVFSIPLLFAENLPKAIKKYLPLYWHVCVTYCIPFFAVIMILKTNFSTEWLINLTLGLFWAVLILDWLSFIVLTFIGSTLGTLAFFFFSSQPISIAPLGEPLHWAMYPYVYIYAIILGLVFSRNKQKIETEKQESILAVSGSIAHEMRTPLAAINLCNQSIRSCLDRIQKKISANENIDFLTQELEILSKTQTTLTKVTKQSHTVINMMLNTLKGGESYAMTSMNITNVLEKIMGNYPFEDREQELISIHVKDNFILRADIDMLQNVFFNLLKNSLYFVKAAHKGSISIKAFQEGGLNKIIFEDTGPGIRADQISRIFQPFHTTRRHGTGLGLSFCKKTMQAFGGDITVASKFGQFTRFTLTFPNV